MPKIDLKDAYFTVSLNKICCTLVSFIWEGYLQQFLCLCLSVGPTHRIFSTLLKVPVSLLCRLNI